jgi:heme-degrading monooxygenase HmoA
MSPPPGPFHLADFNVARMRAPLDDPLMERFTSRLQQVNAIADRSPGFVWRLQTEDGDATAIRPYAEDDRMLVNLTVWESVEALAGFVYRSAHAEQVRDGPQMFERLGTDSLVLFWIPAGTIPTVEEGIRLLEKLRAEGPTADAFTFSSPFPPPA